jgi:hypothetical protein
MMTDKTRSLIYLILGFSSLGITVYLLNLGWNIDLASRPEAWLVTMVPAGAFILVGILNFCSSYAFGPGRVDEVIGPAHSASLMSKGKLINENVRLRNIRPLGLDDPSRSDEQRRVLFFANWRPSSCRLDKFKVIR